MCGHTAKNERRQEGERHDEGVEETIVAFPHTVAHPRTVMVESLHTVVTQAAVGGAWRPEHLAGEAVLELHHLLVDEDFLGAWWRPIAGVSSVVNLFFYVCSLIWCCSGQDAGVSEAGLEQSDDHKNEEDSSNDRYAAGQVFDQEGTVKYKE